MMCRKILSQGRALRLKSLFERMDYLPDASVTYAEGFSVVHFLIGLKGRAPVLEFVKSGMKDGWGSAAKHWYEFESLDLMEKAWIDSLRRTAAMARPKVESDDSFLPVSPPVEVETPQQPESRDLPPPAQQKSQQAPAQPSQPPAPATQELQQAPAQIPPAPDRMMQQPSAPAYPPPLPAANQLPATPPMMPSPRPDTRQTKSPIVVDASIDGQYVVCRFPKSTFVMPVTSYRQVGGTTQAVTSYVRQFVQEEHRYHVKSVEVIGLTGKPIDEKELASRLAKETPALFVENRSFDPRLLSMLKPDVLIISVSESLIPPPPTMVSPPSRSE